MPFGWSSPFRRTQAAREPLSIAELELQHWQGVVKHLRATNKMLNGFWSRIDDKPLIPSSKSDYTPCRRQLQAAIESEISSLTGEHSRATAFCKYYERLVRQAEEDVINDPEIISGDDVYRFSVSDSAIGNLDANNFPYKNLKKRLLALSEQCTQMGVIHEKKAQAGESLANKKMTSNLSSGHHWEDVKQTFAANVVKRREEINARKTALDAAIAKL